jgi:DNA-binding CsgD family transcriptional regulator
MRLLSYLRDRVTRLRTSELEALLAFLGEAHAVDTPEPFTTEVLDRLAALASSTAVAFEEVDFSRRLVLSKFWSTRELPPGYLASGGRTQELSGAHRANMDASPTAVHRRTTGEFGMLKWSDFLSRRERASYAVDFKQDGVIDQASVWLAPSLVHKVSLVFESARRDFTERDRLLLNVLQPHLARLYRDAAVRRLLTAARVGLEQGVDSDGRGVVLRRRDGGLEFVSPEARRLLNAYFDDRGGQLPAELEDWIRTEARRPDRSRAGAASPFASERPGRRLIVHAAGADLSTLLLAEEPAPAVALTARERDVLRCVAAGNSNAEIARLLWIAPGTVRKHLEHIYDKLGVRSRTAAVARLRSGAR